jgi:hypothetical protein
MCNSMRQGVCLARPGARDNQKRAGNLRLPTIRNTVLDSLPLSDVQTAQKCRGIHVKRGLAHSVGYSQARCPGAIEENMTGEWPGHFPPGPPQ